MSNRIFYGCLGIANCGGTPIQGVQSVLLSANRSVQTLFTPGNKNAAAKYSNLPDIELSYSEYIKNIISFDSEPGLNDYTGFTILAGSDTSTNRITAPLSNIGFKQLLLSSVTYTFAVDSPFLVERKYKGWSSGACSSGGLGVFANASSSMGSVKRKGCFTASSIPSEIGSSNIQSVTVTFSINRNFLNQFATTKPYASYVSFPIETSCVFDILPKSLSSINFPEPQLCQNSLATGSNISLSVPDAGSISIPNAILTSLNYSGGEAKSGGGNLRISATYTSYDTPLSLKPFIIL